MTLQNSHASPQCTGYFVTSPDRPDCLGRFLTFILALCLVLTCGGSPALGQDGRRKPSDASKKEYRWLFNEQRAPEPPQPAQSTSLLETLDREIKQARKLYLSGETDNAILKYRTVVDRFETLLDDIPPGHPLLKAMEERFGLFDELATKILGPIHIEPREELAGQIFHVFEKKRICRRNIVLKKIGPVEFFDVPASLVREEAEILTKLADARTPEGEQAAWPEQVLKTKLAEVRASLHKSSARYALLRKGPVVPLADFRKDVLGPDEMVLDFNLLPDRMAIGVLTAEKAVYYQVAGQPNEVDTGVFHLQEMLREFSMGGKSSFMGHAWKEPCRRIYRSLLGKFPPFPDEKRKVLIIPDRSLWYLPFSIMLDAEDRPFGRDKLVSLVPSADMLRFQRTIDGKQTAAGADLVLLESIPWIAEEEIREAAQDPRTKKPAEVITEAERIQRLILTNPVYPKPSEMVVAIQKIFKKFHVWVGPAATADRLREFREVGNQVIVLAAPCAMPDAVSSDRMPSFFFSPDARGQRVFDVRGLFGSGISARLIVVPISWFETPDRSLLTGDGPLILSTAMLYGGAKICLINYSDPNWGAEDRALLAVLKKLAANTPASQALTGYAQDMAGGLDDSFSGKPPAWTGWVLIGGGD